MALASCNADNGVNGASYSSSSSEGFVWASSYSSSSPTALYVEPGCMIGGCSSEICTEEGSDPVVSACIYRKNLRVTNQPVVKNRPVALVAGHEWMSS